MIIDYDDMVNSGMISKVASNFIDNNNNEYAIFLNTPSGSVGKFKITTREDILNSIDALNKNASLPDYIKKPAMKFVKIAAQNNNISTDWEDDGETYSRHVDFVPHISGDDPLCVVKIAGHNAVEIRDAYDYKVASDMFVSSGTIIPPAERIDVAGKLLKVAISLSLPCDKNITALAHAEYSPNVPDIIDKRIRNTNDDAIKDRYAYIKTAYIKLAEANHPMPPDMFLDAIEEIDRDSGLIIGTTDFFQK